MSICQWSGDTRPFIKQMEDRGCLSKMAVYEWSSESIANTALNSQFTQYKPEWRINREIKERVERGREQGNVQHCIYFFLSLSVVVWPLEMFCCQPKSACCSARLCQPRVMVLISSARLLLESRSYMKDLFSAVLVFLQMSPVHIGGHESSRVVEAAATCFYVRTCLHTQIKIKLDHNPGLQHPSSCLHGSKCVKAQRSRVLATATKTCHLWG